MHCDQTIELARCVHCGARVVNPVTDECPNCGSEVSDTTHIVGPGSYVMSTAPWTKADGNPVGGGW